MFAVNTTPYNFATLFDTLQGLQQYQQHQRQVQQQQQYQDTRPKIVKKVETEDSFQIQIFKKSGTFNLYEVKVLRNSYPYSSARSSLVNLVIESKEDEFRKVFQFNLDDIDVSNIDWEYFQDQNVLVLNVPKKVRYCSDDFANTVLAGLFGVPHFAGQIECHNRDRKNIRSGKESRKAERREERELRRQEDAELAAARRAAKEKKEAERREAEREAARIEAEKREAERIEAERLAAAKLEEARREAARKAEEERQEALRQAEIRRQQEEEARKREAEKARRIAEERARREAALKQKKQEARKQEQLRQEEEYKRRIAAQQEVLRHLFGGSGFFPYGFDPVNGQAESTSDSRTTESGPQSESTAAPTSTSAPTSASVNSSNNPAPQEDVEMTDSDSINSDLDVADDNSDSEKLHKHPSLEEVEDEEFVMFRKKFGDK